MSGRLADWLQIAANLGILVGLILVAVQISQTNSLTGYQLNANNYETIINQTIATAGENPQESMYRVLLQPETATEQDYFVADLLYQALLAQVHRLTYLSGAGLAGDNNSEGSLQSRARWFACPYGIAFLDEWIPVYPEGSEYRDALEKIRTYAKESPSRREGMDIRLNNLANQLDQQ